MGKRVVLLHPAYWEQAMGGAELQILYLAKELVNEGFEVHYIFEDKGVSYSNVLGVHLHPLKKINLSKKLGQRWFLYSKIIKNKLNQLKPDIIYTRFYSSWSGVAASYSMRNQCKHIWAVASDNDLKEVNFFKQLIKPFNIIEKLYMERVFKKTSIIVTQNTFQQNLLKTKYDREGLKISQLTEFVKEENISKIGYPLRVLWVANFKPLKRPELFLEVVREMSGLDEFKFEMIGRSDEKYKDLLKNSESNFCNFKYLGEITNEEVNESLLKADVLVNTSVYEGFSNTFVQAWMRKTIVLSMNSNPDEIITTQNIGYVCPTINHIIDCLHSLSVNKNLREEMSQKAYNYAVKNHSLKKGIKKIIDLM